MRFIAAIVIFCAGIVFISSCEKNSTASPIPSISFNSFQATGANTGTLQINFTDGDGDIGYQTQDPSTTPDMWIKYLYYDTASKQYIGIKSAADSATFDSIYFVYHLPYLTPSGKNKNLSGIIQIAMNDYYLQIYNDPTLLKVQFEIWIYDRAGHKSNVIRSRIIYPGSANP